MTEEKKAKIVEKVKVAGEFVSSGGAQALACGIVRAVLPPGLNVVVQGGVLLGGLMLGGFIGEKLNGYVERQIDQTINSIEETADRIKRDIAELQDKNEE